jgi:hypothetical protein
MKHVKIMGDGLGFCAIMRKGYNLAALLSGLGRISGMNKAGNKDRVPTMALTCQVICPDKIRRIV